MNIGPAELLPIALLFWALPIVAAVWVLLTLARIRRALERIADSLAALAARGDELR
jgi:TRAP-type C4-dicarboxylate transport system permease small subunit